MTFGTFTVHHFRWMAAQWIRTILGVGIVRTGTVPAGRGPKYVTLPLGRGVYAEEDHVARLAASWSVTTGAGWIAPSAIHPAQLSSLQRAKDPLNEPIPGRRLRMRQRTVL